MPAQSKCPSPQAAPCRAARHARSLTGEHRRSRHGTRLRGCTASEDSCARAGCTRERGRWPRAQPSRSPGAACTRCCPAPPTTRRARCPCPTRPTSMPSRGPPPPTVPGRAPPRPAPPAPPPGSRAGRRTGPAPPEPPRPPRPRPDALTGSVKGTTVPGGRAVFDLGSDSATLVSATPDPGWDMRIWNGSHWIRVAFSNGSTTWSVFCRWRTGIPASSPSTAEPHRRLAPPGSPLRLVLSALPSPARPAPRPDVRTPPCLTRPSRTCLPVDAGTPRRTCRSPAGRRR